MNNATFVIREFRPPDQEDVIKLWDKCRLTVPQNDPRTDIEKKVQFQPQWFFVGILDGRLISSMMVGYEGHRGWINYLAVLPDFQRRGFGRKMMEKAEFVLREVGCPKINLQVRKSNTSVIQFYEACGYSEDAVTSLGKRL
ncbi:MAG: GNAT family acetyltransferase [Theionarchaea archaeon]|nr:GNAT family acetyltransferase [Theionarchaea archaeon]MBU7037869.1 GNAT family acetyltransferase [Theionarchaea archaeon]